MPFADKYVVSAHPPLSVKGKFSNAQIICLGGTLDIQVICPGVYFKYKGNLFLGTGKTDDYVLGQFMG